MFKGRSFLVKMVKDDEAGHEEEVDVTEDIRSHFQKNKNAYIAGIVGFTFASITCLYMRGRYEALAPGGAYGPETADTLVTMRPLSLLSNRMTNVVTVIDSNRQGPPSWVVRCLETGNIFTSQNAAADAMGLSATNLSQHLNGVQDSVNGFTFERICMAA